MRYRLRELMILVAVGPPLLAGVVWVGNNLSWTSRCSSLNDARVQVAMLKDAVLAYSIDVGRLPRDLMSLLVVTPDLNTNEVARWRGPYLDKTSLPVDYWDQEFRYEVMDAEHSRFRIWSMGPDRASRTRDDLVAEN